MMITFVRHNELLYTRGGNQDVTSILIQEVISILSLRLLDFARMFYDSLPDECPRDGNQFDQHFGTWWLNKCFSAAYEQTRVGLDRNHRRSIFFSSSAR